MKKSICLFFTLALVWSVSAVTSANATPLLYNLTWSTTSPGENAYNTWAPFTVTLPSNVQLPSNISSYDPTSLTLTLDVIDPYAKWKVIVGNDPYTATIVSEYSHTVGYNDTGTITFKLNSSDFNNTGYNWYDPSIQFSTYATGCHVFGATYTMDPEPPTNTPEPGTILLLGLGLAGLAVLKMKFRPGTAAIS